MIFHFYNKKGLFLFILLTFSTSICAFSQVSARTEPSFFDNVRFGGSLGLGFSNGLFNANLAPRAIYDFNRYTSAGIGLQGSYTNARSFSAYTYGGSILGLLRPIQAIQLSAEFEELRVIRNLELDGANRTSSYWYPALFLGAGYTTGAVTVGLRYDLLHDHRSIYGTALMPFVSVLF